MPRASTTLDPFNAIAEPKRRQMLETLAAGEQPVNDLVEALGWSQPVVSKHLAVLKEVGLVSMRQQGRQRYYRINAEVLKPVHDWTKSFERFWTHHLDGIKQLAERKQRGRNSDLPST